MAAQAARGGSGGEGRGQGRQAAMLAALVLALVAGRQSAEAFVRIAGVGPAVVGPAAAAAAPRALQALDTGANAGRRRARAFQPAAAAAATEPPSTTAGAAQGSGGGGAGGGLTDVLARKAKQAEVEAFKKALPPTHPIFAEIDKAGQYERSSVLYNALCHRKGNTLTVVAEYYRKAPWGFLGSVLDAAEYSEIYREAGASAIAVNVDPLTGGCSHQDIQEMAREQRAAAANDVNAPVPIIAADVVVDPVQVSRAKLAGASGVTLRYGLNPTETTRALIDLTFALGMEPVVQVKSVEEAQAATAMGAQLLFLVGTTRSQAIEMRPQLAPDGDNAPVMVGFDLRRPKEFQYGLNEVEDAWVLRDHRFHAVYASNLLFQTPLDDVVGPSAVIRALRAKACHFMVDPLDWIEKAVTEGTKETLGELLA